MSRFDDRQRGFCVEQFVERARDGVGQILLKDQTVRERVAQLRDPAQARHTVARHERDVRHALSGHQMVRADEHQRDARGDDRPGAIYRKPRTERLSGSRPIAVEQTFGEGAGGGLRCGRQRGIARGKSERAQKFSQRSSCTLDIRRFFCHSWEAKAALALKSSVVVVDTVGRSSYGPIDTAMIMPSHAQVRTQPMRTAVRYAEADIPTVHGSLRVVVYRTPTRAAENTIEGYEEHVAIVVGNIDENLDDVLVRVHSECLTSEVFGSLKCDCREQLDAALMKMREKGAGILVYLRQEGRGIGLGNKIRAYAQQARGADTVEANHRVGFETDLRTYGVAASMLADLGVRGVSLMTNNPRKVDGLLEHGTNVVRRVPHQVAASAHSARYLATKRDRLGHLLDLISPVGE